MKNKKLFTMIALSSIMSIGALVGKTPLCVSAEALEDIVDNLDDTSKMSDFYSIFAQSGDVGFGVDGRYISTYSGDVAPTPDTVWGSEPYGYINYSYQGHNLLKVVADEGSKSAAPIVYAHGKGFVECDEVIETTSSNWTRREYQYVLSGEIDWVRIWPSAYGSDNWVQQLTQVVFTNVETIEDNLDDTSKMSDFYSIFAQSGDVGFGTDGRYISTYSGDVAPTPDTVWGSEPYGYINYSVAGQNLLSVFADEGSKSAAPIVFAHGATFVDALKVIETTSSNWTRREYQYVLPAGVDWVRIWPSAYGSDNWVQQLTKVVISKAAKADLPVKESGEDVEEEKFLQDDLEDTSKTTDAYSVFAQTTDVGFGADYRYVTTATPTEMGTASNWYESDRAYLQYGNDDYNLASITVDAENTCIAKLPHIGFVANYGGLDNRFLEVNNYSIERKTDWSRITYKFIIPEGASWLRVVFTAYNSYDNSLATWMQQVTSVRLSKVSTLPEKDENIPSISPIVRPEPAAPIIDEIDTLDGNEHLSDFYGVVSAKLGEDNVAGLYKTPTTEPTADTWWSADYGYIQFKGDGSYNLLTVNAYASEAVLNYCPDLMVYAGAGNMLKNVPVNTKAVGELNEFGLYPVTYTFALSGQSAVRLVYSVYNAPDGSFSTDEQLITRVSLECAETVPSADPVDTSHDSYCAELDAYLATVDLSLYSDDNKALIKFIINSAKNYLKNGKAEDDAAYVANVKERIANVKTLEQEKNEALVEIKRDFETFFNSFDPSEYTEENYAKITKIYRDTLAEIEEVDDLEQIKEIIADAKEDMNAVEKIQAPTVTRITVSGAVATFNVGDEFVTTGLVVTAAYSDGSTKDVTRQAVVNSTAVDMTKAGTYTVTVTYEGCSATYDVTVNSVASKGGCGGSVAASAGIIGLISVLGIVFASKKKKEDR